MEEEEEKEEEPVLLGRGARNAVLDSRTRVGKLHAVLRDSDEGYVLCSRIHVSPYYFNVKVCSACISS